MKLALLIQFGRCGFGVKYSQFDAMPTKWLASIRLGICAVAIVWGDSTALRAFFKQIRA